MDAGWLQVRLGARFWDLGQCWGAGFPQVCTHCGVLGPDCKTLVLSGLVKRPGVGANSGGTCSLQTSGSLLRSIAPFNCWGKVVGPIGLWLASGIL